LNETLDCAVVGAGPGGLTAAIYLSRYRRSSLVLHTGDSRARWIPASHNCPGFPSGIGGREYLARLAEQALSYGAQISLGEVETARLEDDVFVLEAGDRQVRARNLILATGSADIMPELENLGDAVTCGAVRFCPICDGYEAMGRNIAVYGPLAPAAQHALFIRTYSPRVTVVPSEPGQDEQALLQMRAAGVEVTEAAALLSFDGRECAFDIGGKLRSFEVVYPMLGTRPRSGLALSLGARCDDKGGLFTTPHQMTSVRGLYAIGDVVSALDQISVATGHAAIAATAVHNSLPRNFAS
jgi:thioredoxin reductase (NADPH)